MTVLDAPPPKKFSADYVRDTLADLYASMAERKDDLMRDGHFRAAERWRWIELRVYAAFKAADDLAQDWEGLMHQPGDPR